MDLDTQVFPKFNVNFKIPNLPLWILSHRNCDKLHILLDMTMYGKIFLVMLGTWKKKLSLHANFQVPSISPHYDLHVQK